MKAAGRYAAKGNQTKENLVHLNDNIIVGEWRDSTYGKYKPFQLSVTVMGISVW